MTSREMYDPLGLSESLHDKVWEMHQNVDLIVEQHYDTISVFDVYRERSLATNEVWVSVGRQVSRCVPFDAIGSW